MFARIERQNKQLCNVLKLQEIDGLCASKKVRNKQTTENSKSEELGSKSRSDKYPFQDGEQGCRHWKNSYASKRLQ
jgi:hypothetical protein